MVYNKTLTEKAKVAEKLIWRVIKIIARLAALKYTVSQKKFPPLNSL